MLSILDVIQRSADFLAKRGVASPRLQVELLLAHALKMPRMKLYLNFERVLSEAELDALRALVQRRGQREPLQYIVGSTSFCGIEVGLNPSVLIPRPETELLAERAWVFLNQLADAPIALDLCAGSGCLAIALAVNAPKSRVHAVEISGEALALARENAAKHGAQIEFHEGDFFSAAPPDLRCDVIVSNPPYIPSSRIEALEPEVRDYEPRLALDGGADGQDFYRKIAAQGRGFLRPEGRVMLELDEDGAEATRKIFVNEGWEVEALEKDYNGQARILIAHLNRR
ncbi:MAG TPA: peptide chain release factor N(5)-glutamine methyltransferase [Verrucomicrobiae bacterium]|nr:peptide chain release factor N(5)-glutamine methyltransferase [Verrucomicrobiae bacterium]